MATVPTTEARFSIPEIEDIERKLGASTAKKPKIAPNIVTAPISGWTRRRPIQPDCATDAITALRLRSG